MKSVEEMDNVNFDNTNEVSTSMLSILKAMRENKEFTDVIIICNGGEFQSAHGNILSAGSPYFRRILQSDDKENVTEKNDKNCTASCCHTIPCRVDSKIMQTILDYLYLHRTDDISNESIENLENIFQASKWFGIKSLSKYCRLLLMKKMDINNWLNVWEVIQGTSCIKDYVVPDFLIDNLSTIATTREFLTLNNFEMLALLSNINQNRIPVEEKLFEGFIKWSKIVKPNDVIRRVFFQLNFDFLSEEFLDRFLENDKNLFVDKFSFYRQLLLPKYGNKSKEIQHSVPAQFCFFGCYRKLINKCFLYEKAGLRMFNCSNGFLKCIEKLPFLFDAGIFPIYHDGRFYVLGGIYNGIAPPKLAPLERNSFFTYDLKTNETFHWPQPPELVWNPLTCTCNSDIFVIESNESENSQEVTTTIQRYSVGWNWHVTKIKIGKVIACVSVKKILYLICWNSKQYFLFKFSYNGPEYHCNIPIVSHEEDNVVNQNVINTNLVTAYKEKIFVLKDKEYNWYVFDPETNLWKVQKINHKFENLSHYRSFVAAGNYLMLYNEKDRKLYHYNDINGQVTEFMTVEGSLQDSANFCGLVYSKYEKLVIINP